MRVGNTAAHDQLKELDADAYERAKQYLDQKKAEELAAIDAQVKAKT